MKANAITRIVLYSILALVLSGVLIGGIVLSGLSFPINIGNSGTVVEGEVPVDASRVKNIEIDWAAGSVHIRTADTEHITICEVLPENGKYKMTYQISGDTLKLHYGNGKISIGLGNHNIPNKDLIITVPKDWVCVELEIDGAALSIEIQDLTVEKFNLDGAACSVVFNGSVDRVDIDGASVNAILNCSNRISRIDMDGAGCKLELTLPKECGFQVEMDGLGCELNTELPCRKQDGAYISGDGSCKIEVSGLGCQVTVQEGSSNDIAYSVRCGDDFTASLLLEALNEQYTPGTIVRLKTEILTDVDLELYINGKFVCKQTEAFSSDGTNYWEFYFTMPDEAAVIHFKTVDGFRR